MMNIPPTAESSSQAIETTAAIPITSKQIALNTIIRHTLDAFLPRTVEEKHRSHVGGYGLPTLSGVGCCQRDVPPFVSHPMYNAQRWEYISFAVPKPTGAWHETYLYDLYGHMFSHLDAGLALGDYFSLASPKTMERIRSIEEKYSAGVPVSNIDDLFFNAVSERMRSENMWEHRERYVEIEFAILKAIKPEIRRFGGPSDVAMRIVQAAIGINIPMYNRCENSQEWAKLVRMMLFPHDVALETRISGASEETIFEDEYDKEFVAAFSNLFIASETVQVAARKTPLFKPHGPGIVKVDEATRALAVMALELLDKEEEDKTHAGEVIGLGRGVDHFGLGPEVDYSAPLDEDPMVNTCKPS